MLNRTRTAVCSASLTVPNFCFYHATIDRYELYLVLNSPSHSQCFIAASFAVFQFLRASTSRPLEPHSGISVSLSGQAAALAPNTTMLLRQVAFILHQPVNFQRKSLIANCTPSLAVIQRVPYPRMLDPTETELALERQHTSKYDARSISSQPLILPKLRTHEDRLLGHYLAADLTPMQLLAIHRAVKLWRPHHFCQSILQPHRLLY